MSPCGTSCFGYRTAPEKLFVDKLYIHYNVDCKMSEILGGDGYAAMNLCGMAFVHVFRVLIFRHQQTSARCKCSTLIRENSIFFLAF